MGETYGVVRGLLPAYETTIVFGTEEDLLALRAVTWADPIYLFPMRATPEQAQRYFAALLARVMELERKPEFYNTVTNNCTTNLISPINRMVDREVGVRVALMPGYSFEEAYARGWLHSDLERETARATHQINDPVLAAAGLPDFSQRIRQID